MRAYHYTNGKAFASIQTPGIDNHYTFGYDDFTGLIPTKRFVRLGRGNNLPEKAHDGIIEALLEPEPTQWTTNEEFPTLWEYLMHDICREKRIILLSFDILPTDEAYVVERAHIERELYREAKGQGKSTKKSMDVAVQKYWDSRIPALEYRGDYDVPQFAIWSPIERSRLRNIWGKPHDEVWSCAQAFTSRNFLKQPHKPKNFK